MAHMFESVSVQVYVPSTEEGRDYERWRLNDYRRKDGEAFCPDTVRDIIVEALLAKGYRLADAEALEGNLVPGYIASPKNGGNS